jgi:AcrR family transcriptional regulator
MRVQREERADAARNRQAILAAADRLFANSSAPGAVTMDDIARAAGVGKGTLFRRFGDRTGLIRYLYAQRLAPLRQRIESGPPPLGPGTPARRRVGAIIDAIAVTKFENMHLTSALEAAESAGSLYGSPDYRDVHALLTGLLAPDLGSRQAAWSAHLLLAAVRADLLRHLVHEDGMTTDQVRSQLKALVGQLLPPDGPGA